MRRKRNARAEQASSPHGSAQEACVLESGSFLWQGGWEGVHAQAGG